MSTTPTLPVSRNAKGQFDSQPRPERRRRVDLVCPSCGETFWVRAHRIERADGKPIHCSISCAKVGKPSHRKGTHLTEEQKEHLSRVNSQIRGERTSRWKGGRYRHKDGYILVLVPGHPFKDRHGYMLEHRLVVETSLGRYLSKDEHIHHINGVKDDNRIENLQVMSNSEHLKLEWFNRETNGLKRCVATQFKKGLVPWNKNPTRRAENRKARRSGKAQEWVRAVKHRDGYRCVQCGVKESVMYAHHILPFATHKEKRYDLDNGQTLCRHCHLATPTFGAPVRTHALSLMEDCS